MKTAAWFLLAALGELIGCFTFWAWLRLGKNPIWLIPGMLALAIFAFALTRVEMEHAGRTFAIYSIVYLVASLAWLWAYEGVRPDKWDVLGASVALIGAGIILYGPRGA